jgi:hypothetical protein
MPGTNRHRAPTPEMLCNRIYRQQLRTAQALGAVQSELQQIRQTVLLVIRQADRLLREKETLLKVLQGNQYMAEPPRVSVMDPIDVEPPCDR